MPKRNPTDLLLDFAESLREAEKLVELAVQKPQDGSLQPKPPKGLLDALGYAKEGLSEAAGNALRTIHHFACTGGTLFAKCLAAMPNSAVLNELDPLSRLAGAAVGRFGPTDLVGHILTLPIDTRDELASDVFMHGLSRVHAKLVGLGIDLIIRDHAHSHFCCGDNVRPRPSFYQLLANSFPLKSILTVRHPMDSYLSLMENRWLHFSPTTIDEYARRYLLFLESHSDLPIFKYEALVAQPQVTMQTICTTLSLPFASEFEDIFPVFQFSGDSGRSGSDISPRPRRSIDRELADQARQSKMLGELCRKLDYDLKERPA